MFSIRTGRIGEVVKIQKVTGVRGRGAGFFWKGPWIALCVPKKGRSLILFVSLHV